MLWVLSEFHALKENFGALLPGQCFFETSHSFSSTWDDQTHLERCRGCYDTVSRLNQVILSMIHFLKASLPTNCVSSLFKVANNVCHFTVSLCQVATMDAPNCAKVMDWETMGVPLMNWSFLSFEQDSWSYSWSCWAKVTLRQGSQWSWLSRTEQTPHRSQGGVILDFFALDLLPVNCESASLSNLKNSHVQVLHFKLCLTFSQIRCLQRLLLPSLPFKLFKCELWLKRTCLIGQAATTQTIWTRIPFLRGSAHVFKVTTPN